MLNLFPEEETKSSYIQSLEESLGEEFNNLSIVQLSMKLIMLSVKLKNYKNKKLKSKM